MEGWESFVRESHRRTGTGARLLAAFELSASGKGCTLISLMTGNPANIRYYEKLGYARDDSRLGDPEAEPVYRYYAEKKHAVFLFKTLT
ncbi:GNAT family N-acetyltransferase [Paenibacillus aurantiacus]|uniref:GNAT family N-acetyltransferase n=1 Tax=Paenibacillus aurantiacus TaxID=1936118 RepID=A0ABV5KT21_9BACL